MSRNQKNNMNDRDRSRVFVLFKMMICHLHIYSYLQLFKIIELYVSNISGVKDASTSQLHQQNDFIYATENYFGSEYKSYFL